MPSGPSSPCCATRAAAPPKHSWPREARTWAGVRLPTSTFCSKASEPMGLLGILLGLALLVALAFRGWSILLLAPAGALVAASISGEPLLAHWTLTFMEGAADFLRSFFPL